MTAPILRWYIADDEIEAPQDLEAATPGTASTASTFDFCNDKDGAGADDASNYVLQMLCQDAEGNWVASGVEALDNYWFELQAFSGLGSLTLSAGSQQPMGTGRLMDVPTLASQAGVRYKLRVNAPGGPESGAEVAWKLVFFRRPSNPLPIGLHESIGPGINLGIGDDTFTDLLYIGGPVVENPGGADDQVRLPDISVVCAGIPYNLIRQLVTLDNTDSAAAALSAGESYEALIYISSAGAISQEKSVKTSGTPVRPSLPSGGIPIAYVIREADADGGDIENADITQAWTIGAAHFSSSSLTGSIGPMRAVLDNRLIDTTTSTTVSLTDDDTNYIWLHPDGSLSVTTTAALPVTRAMLLWEAVAASGSVTSSTDRRLFLGSGFRFQRLDFLFDATLSGGQKQRLCYHGPRTGYILPIGGIAMHLLDNGDTSGATTVDVNIRAPGGSFTTVFTSQGSEDRRPSLAHDSTALYDSDAFPEVLAVAPHSLLEVEIDAVPGGSVPDWLNVSILIACP